MMRINDNTNNNDKKNKNNTSTGMSILVSCIIMIIRINLFYDHYDYDCFENCGITILISMIVVTFSVTTYL